MAAREGIKANNRIGELVTGAFRHLDEITCLKQAVLDKVPRTLERDRLGMAIRRWDANGGQWKLHVILAILVEAIQLDASLGKYFRWRCMSDHKRLLNLGFEPFLVKWQEFLDHIVDMDLIEAASFKRIIDGKQLSKELNAKPGVWMAPALEVVMAWQFRNPTATDPQGAIDEVMSKAAELKIPMK